MTVMVRRWPIVGRGPDLAAFERVLSSGRDAGLVIHGRIGVGKTRLAEECARLAAAAGHPTERVAGSRSTALVPLGAVAGLLGGSGSGPGGMDTAALFERSRQALHQRYGGRRLVTVADDVSLLDSASLALLGYLAAQGTIFLVATARSGEQVPDLVTDLWREGRLERIDLEDLSRSDLDTLLPVVLGGPVEAATRREFWQVTRGNPLYVRELVLGCLASGVLVERSGVWHLEGPVPSTARLSDLVEQRIGGLSAAARSVVELLAVCEPLELGYLETAAPAGVLESLERAGLVTIAVAEAEVRLAHPLHGTVVRAGMPGSRARAILLTQASRLEATSPAGPAALRIAMWRLDAGGRPDPAVLVRSAHLARYAHDFRTVRRLTEAVPGADLDAAGALLLGEALYELGDFAAAEQVLARGQQLPSSEPVALRLAVTRAKNAQWGLCRPETALAINTAARAVVTSGPLAEELVADEASVLTFSGHPDRALAVLERMDGTGQRTRVVRAIAAAPALAVTGRTAEAVQTARVGYADHLALGDELAIAHPAMHLVNQAFALTEAGRLDQARQMALQGAEIVAARRVPIAQIFFAANLGRVATLQGLLATARRYYAEAAGLAQAHRFAGPRRLALSGLALAHAMLGEADAAARVLAERDAGPTFGFRGPEQQLADAWTAYASGQPVQAAQLFRDAAAHAASTGYRTAEAWLLHDLTRTSGESHMLASSLNRAEVSPRWVRIRSCRSHASAVRCPVEAAWAAASRNRSADSTGRRAARAVQASASCCSGSRKPNAGPVSRSASARAAASASPSMAYASARPDRARRRGPAKRFASANPAASA